jgi:hypothetical protein
MNTFHTFPDALKVENKDQFFELLFTEHLSILRKDVMMHMLVRKENDFVDLDTFNRKYVNDMKRTHEMVSIVRDELKKLGWNTFLGFGDTGLYIYSTEDKPVGAY